MPRLHREDSSRDSCRVARERQGDRPIRARAHGSISCSPIAWRRWGAPPPASPTDQHPLRQVPRNPRCGHRPARAFPGRLSRRSRLNRSGLAALLHRLAERLAAAIPALDEANDATTRIRSVSFYLKRSRGARPRPPRRSTCPRAGVESLARTDRDAATARGSCGVRAGAAVAGPIRCRSLFLNLSSTRARDLRRYPTRPKSALRRASHGLSRRDEVRTRPGSRDVRRTYFERSHHKPAASLVWSRYLASASGLSLR